MLALLSGCLRNIFCNYRQKNKEAAAEPKTVNILVGFFWLLNCQLSTGFLGIPFSFVHAGLLAGLATFITVVFICWMTSNWLLEVLSRAQVKHGQLISCRMLLTVNSLAACLSQLLRLITMHCSYSCRPLPS